MPPLQNPNSYQAPQPGNDGQSPYDFFMEPGNSPRQSMSPGKKMALIVGAAVALLAGLAAMIALLAGTGSPQAPQLVSVVQSQQEIVRVASEGRENVQAENLKNFSVTASTAVASQQAELTGLLAKQDIEIDKDQIELGKKPQTDQALTAALSSSTYDTTYTSIMQTELNTYEKRLEEATAASVSEGDRALLQKYTVGAQLLRMQLTTP
ncbi:MAG TPA: hypothetical protein VK978_01200 [Candidatus Saccharimonadales bacterium]|nr:hypothetical protein [Candidatus Saccharimonadales bacterium]